ncbi:GntR family transcriptional regulator [Affinibrenneria salicis]|uniref:GntR family transcriptional regulator n=1 Tax=Affinibrenneria salicis TaxID=2590031 RepID=A0A5J5G1J7_9GAMM|nr:GntR family transcriptional regulator [Affinibrenneria salicis]KAA9000518.1 GntR family transcriptional regulator [Affinibrenneria salicis]
MELVRENMTSLYQQIADTLRQEINDGRYNPSGKLPSESELEKRFAVSRVTVRLALRHLTEQGLIERKQGKGSYVSGKKVAHGINIMRSFHESLRQQGLNASMRLLSKNNQPTSERLQRFFHATPTLTFIERLHLVDDEPIALGRSYFSIFSPTLSWQEIEVRPTWALLEQSAGQNITRADIAIRLHYADKTLANTLAVATGAPLFLLERTSWFADTRCAEHSLFYIRPERYEFTLSNSESGAVIAKDGPRGG